jgi:adenosine 3'-phospho 5'-phosphosulfate transporter B2
MASVKLTSATPKQPCVGDIADIFYTLALNFLLYVVLIIVFYMLMRFYLEEETTSSKFNGYTRLHTEDDTDTENEIENSTLLTGDSESKTVQPESKPDEYKNVLELEETETIEAKTISKTESSGVKQKTKRSNSFLNLNEWGEPEGTKQEVLQRLTMCSVGLVVSFCIWGLLQERMLTQPYGGDNFESTYGLVFLNRLGGLILSAFLMWYYKVDWVPSPLWEHSFPSVANMLSSWCQYEALKYVTFPTQMLAKSFKIVPVMLMGIFLLNRTYESFEFISAAMIAFGLFLFIATSEHLDLHEGIGEFSDPECYHGPLCGVVLLLLFLFFDSFTGQWQTRMFELNKKMSPLQMMLIMNAFSAVFSFITLVHQEELHNALLFVIHHRIMIIHLLIFNVSSTVGQLLIFYTVKSFGAVVFSVIMSTRILFSTILSCIVYNHPITELGYLGIMIVFGAMAYRTHRKTDGKPLIKWRETEESKKIFHEWHEHLDI